MEARFIYRNRSNVRSFGASTRGPDKVIVYVNGLLCAMDREAKIIIPVSRWKLAAIGLACFWAALKGGRAVPRSPKAVPRPQPAPEARPDPEAVPREDRYLESSESGWESLIQEMRDLSR
jgi:hypothetical protein